MPRKRKPVALHQLQGTLRPDMRDRLNEPRDDRPLGEAPADWPADLRAIWAELADSIPPGVAFASDRLIVELTARLLKELRDPMRPLSPAMASQVRTALASLGLTPADRSRIAAPAYAAKDPSDRFFPQS